MQFSLFVQGGKSRLAHLCALGVILCMVLFSTGCASSQRKIFVYGFGTMTVPQDSTIEDINGLVRDVYGTNLSWTPR